MKNLFKNVALQAAARCGSHLVRQTDLWRLRDLIASLRPVDPGKPLVRLGPAGDGGYLVPDDLDGIDYCFSPGVSTESGFEQALADRGITVFLADASVDGPASQNKRFHFIKRFIGCFSDETFITLDRWKSEQIPEYTSDLLIQMDIERAEYEVLAAISEPLLAQVRIFVIEFHDLDHLFGAPLFALYSRVFQKLLTTHAVVHIHPNNDVGSRTIGGIEVPRLAEFTFYRRDRFTPRGMAKSFPHPLDAENTSNQPLPLPPIWYGS